MVIIKGLGGDIPICLEAEHSNVSLYDISNHGKSLYYSEEIIDQLFNRVYTKTFRRIHIYDYKYNKGLYMGKGIIVNVFNELVAVVTTKDFSINITHENYEQYKYDYILWVNERYRNFKNLRAVISRLQATGIKPRKQIKYVSRIKLEEEFLATLTIPLGVNNNNAIINKLYECIQRGVLQEA